MVHYFTYFFRMRLGKRAAEDGKILAENKNEPSVNCAVPCYNAVAEVFFLLHPEIMRAVLNKCVHFLKAVAVKQNINSLTRQQLSFFMLGFYSFLAASEL